MRHYVLRAQGCPQHAFSGGTYAAYMQSKGLLTIRVWCFLKTQGLWLRSKDSFFLFFFFPPFRSSFLSLFIFYSSLFSFFKPFFLFSIGCDKKSLRVFVTEVEEFFLSFFLYLFIYLFISSFIYLFLPPFFLPFFLPLFFLSFYLPLFISSFIFLSFYLSIFLSIYLSFPLAATKMP